MSFSSQSLALVLTQGSKRCANEDEFYCNTAIVVSPVAKREFVNNVCQI